jgi:hypothetical protein
MNHSGSTPVFGIWSSEFLGSSSSCRLVQVLYFSCYYLVFRFCLRALAVTAEMEAVAKPDVPAVQGTETAEDKAESDDEESGEPFILGVLNED